MQARGDAALKKAEAVRARANARNKAKEAKLADLDRRQADLAKRVETAAGQQNFAALAAISEESNKLAAEREAPMSDSVAETELTAIDAEVTRDQTAPFTMSYGRDQCRDEQRLQADGVCRWQGLSPGLPGEER